VQKKLTKHGSSLALIIDKRLLKLLCIDAHTMLSVMVEGGSLIITPVDPENRRKRFEAGLAEGHRKYGKAFKRLAD
jgi:antitoxin component of MazEF toxin-antitoxin module